MEHKYGTVTTKQFYENKTDIVNQIFKLLPYKENANSNLDYYFDTLLFRISGLNSLLNEPSELMTVLSLLEAARSENDFKLYRKAVLDSCTLIHQLFKRVGDVSC